MPIGSPQWMYSAGPADQDFGYSLRFNNDDSAYLSKTPTSAGNRKTWTFSCWIKRNNLGVGGVIFGAVGDNARMRWSSDRIQWEFNNTQTWRLTTTQKFRDPSAWFHILINVDTTQGTASNRMSMYINGVKVTAFDNEDYPTADGEGGTNNNSLQSIGRDATNSDNYLDSYLAEVHFIDGTALTPTSFGETGDYGEWKPKTVSGLTYGTNGFYLSFAGGGIMAATGGTITTVGDYKVHSFTSNGTFTPTSVPSVNNYVEYLVIAGGGSGGQGVRGDGVNRSGGGGGAGGYRTGMLSVTAQAYSITVGAGGAAVAPNSGSGANPGLAGSNSVFSTITSIGGGGGGSGHGGAPTSGGSGGGGAHHDTSGGAATSGQGNAGGRGYENPGYHAGGGGGAGAVGADGVDGGPNGAGGAGLASSITGSSVTRAGGGGGGGTNTDGAGGSGGGTAGDSHTAATANTGSGGGGAGNSSGNTGAGGSGIVILRYKFQ